MKTHTELIECWSDRCYSRLDSLSNQRNRQFTQNEVDFIKTAFQLFLNKFPEHFSVDECESLISSLEGSSQSRDTCFVVRGGELYQINGHHCDLKLFYEVHFGYFLAKLFNDRLTNTSSPHMIERTCNTKDGHGCLNPQHYQATDQRYDQPQLLAMPTNGENFNVMDQHEFMSSVQGMAEMDRLSFQPERFQTAALQSSLQQQARPTLQQQQEQQQQETPTIVMQNETQDEKPSIEEINKQTIENFRSRVTRQRFWCKIAYHELQDRVGETWEAPSEIESIVIDGYANPFDGAPNRFSLGLITNINRRPEADRTRRFIGRGISLLYEDGCVWLLNESDSAVFIQSPICNITKNWHPATVVKVVSQSNIKLFERERFEDVLCAKFRSGYEETYNLVYVCKIRMSFVKGWGAAYSRATVSQCPCWIEISLNEPLAWLDAALRELKPIDHLNSIS